MATKNPTIRADWTETVMDGSDFLLSLPFRTDSDVVVATTDVVKAPTGSQGHKVQYGLRNAITRELLGPGYVWAKASGSCGVSLSTWSSDLAAILALGGIIGYWPTDPDYLYSDDAGVTPAAVDGVVGYRANLVTGGPAAVQSTLANKPILHKYSLSDFYWLETDDGSSTLTATTGDLGSSCTVAYANANGAVFTEGVTISSTYSTTPEIGYNGDFMIFNRALTSAEKTLITRHLTRDRDFVQRELLAISGLTGYWKADPQYLFEDSAGTTPASTSGTGPIGQWRAVGVTPTLTAVTVANSGFDADTNWTKGTGWAIGSGVATKTAGSAASLSQAITLTAGSVYLITWTMTRTAGTLLPRFTGGTTVSGTALSASGTYAENLVAVTGNTTLEFYGDASFAGTVDGVSVVVLTGVVAVEATTANKPILRKTPTTGVYWADSNTATSMLTVVLGNLGSSCTVARATPDGVKFAENVSITSTYNIAPAYGFNTDVAIFNRALTATEKALITRYMQRSQTLYGSFQNAIPQIRGYLPNNETVPNWSSFTSFDNFWKYSGATLTSFSLIDTSAATSFNSSWFGCSGLTSFPLINTSAATNLGSAWQNCPGLSSFPLIDTASVTNFYAAWYGCASLTSFPLINTSAAITFNYSWYGCTGLTSFPLINAASVTNFSNAWRSCTSLTSFPVGFFDSWVGVPAADCFLNAWNNCTALTQTSLQNIAVSLATSGISAPASGKEITLNGAPTLATMQADTTFMTAVTTLKARNWIPTYKGTAL